MVAIKCWAISLLLSVPAFATATEQHIHIRVQPNQQTAILLEARQAPLAQLLDEIAAKTQLRIHHSIPVQTRVSANCLGTDAKQIVQCLLGSEANFMFRQQGTTGKAVELWVLDNPEETEVVRNQWQPRQETTLAAKDPTERVQALSLLIADNTADQNAVLNALEDALSDPDASVRAQAIYGLSRRDSVGAAARLRDALQDSDPSVRLMAVDSAGTDTQAIALLRQALTDRDETVSTLAALKLEALANQGITR